MQCIFDSERRFDLRRVRDIRVRIIDIRLYLHEAVHSCLSFHLNIARWISGWNATSPDARDIDYSVCLITVIWPSQKIKIVVFILPFCRFHSAFAYLETEDCTIYHNTLFIWNNNRETWKYMEIKVVYSFTIENKIVFQWILIYILHFR